MFNADTTMMTILGLGLGIATLAVYVEIRSRASLQRARFLSDRNEHLWHTFQHGVAKFLGMVAAGLLLGGVYEDVASVINGFGALSEVNRTVTITAASAGFVVAASIGWEAWKTVSGAVLTGLAAIGFVFALMVAWSALGPVGTLWAGGLAFAYLGSNRIASLQNS